MVVSFGTDAIKEFTTGTKIEAKVQVISGLQVAQGSAIYEEERCRMHLKVVMQRDNVLVST